MLAEQAEADEPLWTPPSHVAVPVPCALSPESEEAILGILDSPLVNDGSLAVAFAGKERKLLAAIDKLSPIEGLALVRRLAASRSDDPIVARLARFEIGRRNRICAFAADPKRRAARAAGR